MTPVVLAYHRVTALEHDPHRLAVPPDAFREQMTWLTERCVPVPLTDVIDTAQHEARSVAITFDDGYLDNLTTASPILTDLHVPATFFVTTERLDDRAYEYWWDRLARVMLQPRSGAGDLVVETTEGRWSSAMDTSAARLDAYRIVHGAAVQSAVEVRDRILDAVAAWAGSDDASPNDRRLTASEIRDLAARPDHSIGVHTERHLFLPVQSAAVQTLEIERSTRTLERLLGRRPNAIAYPFGAASADVVDITGRLGFRLGVTMEDRAVTVPIDPLRVPRLEVTPSRSARFNQWLTSVFDAA